jgi:chromate transporter
VPTGGATRDYQADLGTVLLEWGRIGVTGFGGPPAHIALLRRLCVDRRGWLDAAEFEDAIALVAGGAGAATIGPLPR